MARTGIYTSLIDTALGNAQASDGIAMIVAPATAQSGTGGLDFMIETAYMITSLKELENMGVTAENNSILHHQVSEFYSSAGSGARLWVVGYTQTAQGLTDFIDDKLETVIRSTTATDFDMRPRMLGVIGAKEYVTETTAEDPLVPEVVTTAIAKLQTVLDNLFSESYRMCAVMDAIMLNCANAGGFVVEQTATRLTDLASLDAPRVGLCVTTTTIGQTASVGQVLGIMAAVGLATSIGSMALEAPAQAGYMLDANVGTYINTNVALLSKAKFDELGEKQYIFLRTRPQMPGVYYNDGATCNDPTMALSSLEFLRVGNAVCDSVEAYFVQLINTNITTNTDGSISNAYKSATLADLNSRFLQPRINAGQAQAINVDFWAHDGNFIASRAIDVEVQILPLASLREVYIETLFVSNI